VCINETEVLAEGAPAPDEVEGGPAPEAKEGGDEKEEAAVKADTITAEAESGNKNGDGEELMAPSPDRDTPNFADTDEDDRISI
jgi:hypothetical protein